jgi:Ca2+-binding RTX toxin-like protein
MISAKAFKPASKPSQPTRDDYAEPEQEKRKFLPVAFLLFLTGCAAYLKSFLPAKLEAREERQDSKRNDSEQSDSHRNNEIGAATDGDTTTGTTDRATKSSDNVVPIRIVLPQEIGDFLASDSPPIDFKALTSPRVDAHPIGDPVRAGNDNRPPAESNSAAAGSGGGGGGGGGGDDKQHERPPNAPRPGGPDADPARNRAPRITGPVHLRDVVGCEALMISVLTLLAGATDPDGDKMRIVGLSASSGTITRAQDGGWVFARDDGMLGDVTLTYTISDGSASVVQTAHFRVVEAPPIVGTAADDNLLGTHCADTIDAGAGDDNIVAREGNDIIIGGSGDDHIIAGPGNDIVYAGAGNDMVFAGAGNDIVFGGVGDDRLFGEDGDDTILGEDGDDSISGDRGADVLLAGPGNDNVQGGAGNDKIDGGDGDDTLDGSEDDDVIADGAGRDTARGGPGNDRVVAAADGSDDAYDGGDDQDTLDYSTATLSVTIDLGRGKADGQDIGHDLISAFEKVLGGSGDDHIVAGSTSVSMTGGKGHDTFEFQRSDDDDSQAIVVRKITDFTVGDRIVAATYEISYLQEEGAEDQISDMFDDIYLSAGGDKRPVRFRFEQIDSKDVTFVDVHDRPDTDEFYSIEVLGHHQLQFTVAVS